MKPSKSGSVRIITTRPPFPDTEWSAAPRNTPSPGQEWLRRVGDFLGQPEPGSPGPQPHTMDGFPPAVGQTVEPFLVFGEPCPAAFWSSRCLPGSPILRSPLPLRRLLRLSYRPDASLWLPIR